MSDGPLLFFVETGERPVSLNDERSSHWAARHRATGQWRTVTAGRLRELGLHRARFDVVDIRLRPVYLADDGKVLPDTGNVFPTEKAIVDGLVDVGVIVDDAPEFVRTKTSEAPCRADVPFPRMLVHVAPVEAPPEPGPGRMVRCSCDWQDGRLVLWDAGCAAHEDDPDGD